MKIADPICCLIPGARRHCDQSYCCSSLGKWGLKYFDRHRQPIMLFMAFLAIVSAITSLIPIISISNKSSVVMDTYWTKGMIESEKNFTIGESFGIVDAMNNYNSYSEVETNNFYIGLTTIVYEYHSHIKSYHWKSTNCTNLNPTNRDYCEECNQACDATISVAIINFITSLPTITTNLKRSTIEGDLNCSKFMSILTGVIGTITTLSSISFFLDGCFRHLPERTIDGRDIHYSYGPGLICIFIPQILKPLDVLVNLLTPVGVVKEMDYDHQLLLADTEDMSVEL